MQRSDYMEYIIDEKTNKEYIQGDGYHSKEYEPMTMFFQFFDMIRNGREEYCTYEILDNLRNHEITPSEAEETIPVLRFLERKPESVYYGAIDNIFYIYEAGKETFESLFTEQREHEESLYKTLFYRLNSGRYRDTDFFNRFNFRKKPQMPITTFGEWIEFCIDYFDNVNYYVGSCDKCNTYYIIKRIRHGALAKNRFCPVCRNWARGAISKETLKDSPLYNAYTSVYNYYYRQFRTYKKIDYDIFKKIMQTAGNVRDSFIENNNFDEKAYRQEVEKEIEKMMYT